MKNVLISVAVAVLVLSSFGASSSDLAFGKGSVHLGFGFNGYHGGSHSFEYYLDYNTTWNNRVYSETIYPYAPGFFIGLDVAAGDITLHYNEYDIDFYNNNGNYHSWERLGMWGVASAFRAGFHPFGMPVLRGKVKVANQLDPYVGFRVGADVAVLDTKGELDNNTSNYDASNTDVDFIFTPTIGVRWYPNGSKVGLWGEIDLTNFLIAVTFNL